MSESKPARSDQSNWTQSGAVDETADLAVLRDRIKGLQDEVAQADKRLRTVLRERPFVSLATAVVAGFVVGRIIGRS